MYLVNYSYVTWHAYAYFYYSKRTQCKRIYVVGLDFYHRVTTEPRSEKPTILTPACAALFPLVRQPSNVRVLATNNGILYCMVHRYMDVLCLVGFKITDILVRTAN